MGLSASRASRCPHTLALALASVVLAILAPDGLAQAHPTSALNLRAPLSGVVHQHEPGVPAPLPSTQALASELEQSTGLTPSQVTVSNVCGPVPVGMARCAAKALRLPSRG